MSSCSRKSISHKLLKRWNLNLRLAQSVYKACFVLMRRPSISCQTRFSRIYDSPVQYHIFIVSYFLCNGFLYRHKLHKQNQKNLWSHDPISWICTRPIRMVLSVLIISKESLRTNRMNLNFQRSLRFVFIYKDKCLRARPAS